NDIPYISLLNQAFDNQLVIANQIGSPSIYGQSTHNRPEYGYGTILAQIKRRQQFVDLVTNVTLNSKLNIDTELRAGLSQWLLAKDSFEKSKAHSDSLIQLLAKSNIEGVSELEEINSQSYLFTKPSYWLVGSDEWSYDLSNSGLQNVISSGEDINILVLETENLDESQAKDVTRPRKKDLGLYAMNFGDVYVASSAINYSYSQAFKLVLEANEFKGPSVVLGYLPIVTGKDKDSLSDVVTLQQTKVAIDTGKWPIYRWLPSTEENGEDQFELFSSSIRKEIQAFLDRSSHLSALSRKVANIPKAQIGSQQINARAQIESKVQDAKDALNALLNGLNGPPLVVLYGSDGGRGEEVARRLDHGAKIRGFSSRCHPANEVPVEDIQHESIVLFVVSTAGQGEFPVNAKEFWKGLSASETTLPNLRFAVFGLGDSKYWPKEEDIIFYNKPGKDIHKKLASLNAQPIIDIGLGDDQDSDGFETQLQAWEPELWKALGAEVISGASDQFVLPTTLSDHDNKLQSNYMRGTIAEGLLDESTGGLSDRDTKLTKFHGIYQQDDRDIREERIERGLEFAYSFMARMRGCAGVFTTAQWLAMDKVAEEHCDGGLKITTRQTLQFHGILKKDLRKAIQGVNKALMTTLAACGDVNRNIMLTSVPVKKSIHDEIFQFSLKLDAHLLPNTNSYHEIWLDDKIVAGQAVQDVEPLYGPSYLPRKFKIAIAIPPSNDVDVRAHCLGYIAIIENDKVIGYNVTVGGGMGATHNNKKTYPRIADLLGFCTPEQAIEVGEKVMLIQRDFGERLNRKHARLKYTIEDMGAEKFKEELANRLGYPLQPAKPYEFKDNADKFGWQTDPDGLWHYNLYLENGRIRDTPGRPWKTGLREIANTHKDVFLLTPNQNLIIKNVKSEDKVKLQELMDKYNLSNVDFSQLRLNSMACVALPTCGLAMAEAERYLPKLIDRLDETILDCGLRDDSIIIRMSGCPNGCSRPYIAEIALVGKAPNTYNLFLGGGFYGDRVAKLYKESVDEEQILEVLRPLIKRYSLE
ncbi:Thiamin diphosphate-binding protein, partial [Conidiobolus coronatus NRRL 28638]